MPNNDSKYQPLAHYDHLDKKPEYDTVGQRLITRQKRFHPWSEEALKIDHETWLKAVATVDNYGYSLDNILHYLIYQAGVITDCLTFKIDPNHSRWGQSEPKQLAFELNKFGYEPRLTDDETDWLNNLEILAGFCTPGEFLNAVAYQLVNHHEIKLLIDQSPKAQEQWAIFQQNITRTKAPKMPIGTAHLSENGSLIINYPDKMDHHF